MFEWRIFKKLIFANVYEFEEYLQQWKKQQKASVKKRIDIYIYLPAKYSDLNRYIIIKNQRQIGLKLRDIKLKVTGTEVKMKGKLIEIKELKFINESNFELWQKIISKDMEKKFKLLIYSCQLLKQLQIENQESTVVELMRKISQKKEKKKLIKYNKNHDQISEKEETQDKEIGKKSVFLHQDSFPIKASELQSNKDQENLYVAHQEDIYKGLKLVFENIKHKIQKYDIHTAILDKYVGILDKSINNNEVNMVIIEKYVSKVNNQEECLIKIKHLSNTANTQMFDQQFNQFYVSCSCESQEQSFKRDEKYYALLKSKYDLPALEDCLQDADFFEGGYPGFLSRFG